jgi:hypothetical protein
MKWAADTLRGNGCLTAGDEPTRLVPADPDRAGRTAAVPAHAQRTGAAQLVRRWNLLEASPYLPDLTGPRLPRWCAETARIVGGLPPTFRACDAPFDDGGADRG